MHQFFCFCFCLFIYLFMVALAFVAVRGLSLVAASGGYSSLQCAGFSSRWHLLLRSMGSRHAGFSSCGMQAQQLWLMVSRAQAQQLWRTGLVALQHAVSSQTRAQTCVPCIGRWILNHCATREAPNGSVLRINGITTLWPVGLTLRSSVSQPPTSCVTLDKNCCTFLCLHFSFHKMKKQDDQFSFKVVNTLTPRDHFLNVWLISKISICSFFTNSSLSCRSSEVIRAQLSKIPSASGRLFMGQPQLKL